ncbi:MAG: hypothetical protein Q9211_005283 [Gyalolechia sp. 1 TL-2023]
MGPNSLHAALRFGLPGIPGWSQRRHGLNVVEPMKPQLVSTPACSTYNILLQAKHVPEPSPSGFRLHRILFALHLQGLKSPPETPVTYSVPQPDLSTRGQSDTAPSPPSSGSSAREEDDGDAIEGLTKHAGMRIYNSGAVTYMTGLGHVPGAALHLTWDSDGSRAPAGLLQGRGLHLEQSEDLVDTSSARQSTK